MFLDEREWKMMKILYICKSIKTVSTMSEEKNITAAGAQGQVESVDSVLDGAQDNMELLNEEGCFDNQSAEKLEEDYSALTLKEIVDRMKSTLEIEDPVRMYNTAEALKSSFYKVLHREKAAAGCDGAEDPESDMSMSELFEGVEKEFKSVYSQFKVKRSKYLQEQEARKELNLECKLAVIEELKKLMENQDDLNINFQQFKELQNRWKEIGPVPQTRVKDVWESYQHQVERFYDYVKINNELRDLDLRKNLEIKTSLCEKAEALKDENDVVEAFKSLQKLHDEWRETGPVAKEVREEIWNRFKEATAVINRKHQKFFDDLKEERRANLEKKTELCVEAEAIADRKDIQPNEWNMLSKKMDELQARWKNIGFAAKKENQKIYDRFREACDRFYTAKREYYTEFKNIMQKNLELKEKLCQQAEAIMNSEEWKKTTDQLINLQKEWKKIGPVARKQSEIVWKRFRAACDNFFDNKAKHFEKVDSEFNVNLEAKMALIEEIKAYVKTGDRDTDMAAMKAFQERWREIGFVPMKEKEKVQNLYKEAMDSHFSEMRLTDSENKLNRFARRIQDIQISAKGGANRILKSEREKLLQKYRKVENDIHTIENNFGFFAKSKNAEQFMADMERKIEAARAELAQIEEKIKLIDKQFQDKQ